MNRFALLLVALFAAPVAMAQQNVPAMAEDDADSTRNELLDSALAELEALDRDVHRIRTSESTESRTRLTEYNRWVLEYRKKAYLWHHNSTIAIFIVVVLVVLSGILLAAWQLKAWITRVRSYDDLFLERLRKGEAIDGELVQGIGNAPSSDASLAASKVAVSSPYVGVIILGLSMGFFLAYLLYVYPVTQGP